MPDTLTFTKMQGVGNDFVVIDGREIRGVDWSGLAIELCDRHFGIGADGLLVLDNTRQADLLLRMYNPDGTPDVCGNGLRCLTRFAVERGIVSREDLRISTLAGTREARLNRREGLIESITVGMGRPRFDPPGIPMLVPLPRILDYPLQLSNGITLPITALSTGSTHAITFVETLPEDTTFLFLSQQVENHSLFPERTSLMWCQVDGHGQLRIRIWERGAGETWGCGTGACATAVAAILHGFASPDAPVSVTSKGGVLSIRWQEGKEIEMTGPAEFVFDGVYPLHPSHPASKAQI